MDDASSFSSIQWTSWDRVNGIAPVLLTILLNRAKMLASAALEPKLPALETELIRGQNYELHVLIKALQDAGVGSLADAHDLQSPSGSE